MRLASVASRFNRMECVDAYTGDFAFYAQLGLYDDTKRDSVMTERRILSVAPGSIIPDRRVVEAAGMRFIIGHGNPDVYLEDVVRVGLVGHVATDLSQVRTAAEVCLDQPGFTAWASQVWVKNEAWVEQSSKLIAQKQLFFSMSEPVAPNQFAIHGGRLHILRAVYDGAAGVTIATVEELPEPTIEVATITGGAYDPVLDTAVGTTTTVRVLRLRWQSLFEYRNRLAPKFGPEDLQVVIAAGAFTPLPGMFLTLSDGGWQIDSALAEGDVWLCRAVRHV